MKNIGSVIGVALVFIYAIGSGRWVNTGDNWYRNLNPPPWQPPDFIFGIIWPYNFLVLAIAAITISQRATNTAILVYLTSFALSVVCALTWAYQFYRPHNLEIATLALAATALITVVMMVVAFKTSTPVAVALLPYQLWVATAATLSYSYSRLN